MLKRFAVLVALIGLVGGLFLPALASAQPAPPASIIMKLVAGLTDQAQVDVIATNGGILRSSIPALRLYVIGVPAAEVADTLARYQADPRVERAEENKVRVSESVPGDPLYPDQWALPKIAWDQVFGTVTPTGLAKVAILDTGVDALHPELAGVVVPGTSILDSSNGMTDPSGHGTWLAGIIAAQTGGTSPDGIAGVAYDGVRIMPVTVLNANGEGLDSDVIAGVMWAVDHGAHVILMAFSNPGFSPALQEAIDYAWSRGVVLVAAAGNGATNAPTFPAGDRGVMGVAATDQNDAQAFFSNEGEAVFIAAPGTDIQTTGSGDAYAVINGTSAAAAHVAGLAAFMKAVDPTLPNGVIVFRIASTADPAGTQIQTGNGRINMARALASTATQSIQPAGAAPLAEGGPFVGPYTAAAVGINSVSPNSGPTSGGTSVTISGSGFGNGGVFTATFGGASATNVLRVNGNTLTATTPAHAAGAVSVVVSDGSSSATLANGFTYQAPRTTSTTVASSKNPSTVGESVTFTATVVGTGPGTGNPGASDGTVDFKADGTTIAGCGAKSLNASGVATCATAALSVGSRVITAVYSGATNFVTSTGTLPGGQTVNKRATSTAVSSNKNPSTFGESVTFTATVTGTGDGVGNPNADGNVTFKADGTAIASCSNLTVNAAGQAQCSTAALTVAGSPHVITAEYQNGTNFANSIGSLAGGQTVNKRATSTAVSSSQNPSTFGESVTFTAMVTGTGPGAGNPNADGNVTFKADGTAIASCSNLTVNAAGQAQCSTAALTVAGSPHAITAEYRNGANFANSTGTLAGGQTVNKRPTSTALSSSLNPSTLGESVTFTATVTGTGPGAGDPNADGDVTFKADGTAIASCSNLTVNAAGQAQCSTAALTVAGSPHAITAEYRNGANFANSDGTLAGGQTVNKRPTSTAVSSSLNPSTFGESVTFTATVTGTGPGTGNPSADGNVTFKVDGTAIASCSNLTVNAAGQAQCSTAALTAAGSPHAITAEYRNGANFADSDGMLAGGQTVNKRTTSTAVSSSPNPSTFGESVTFTAMVTGTGHGTGNPNADGDVTFKADGTAIASCSNVAVNASGQAQCSTAALTVAGSPHVITAEYRNGANFANSDGSLVGGQTVNKRATSTALSSSKNPSTFGESVTFTAMVTGTGPGAGNPNADGNVTFKVDGTAIASCSNVAVNASGQAQCSTAALTATAAGSPHAITAEYRNGANFANSDGSLAPGQTVYKRTTSTVVTSNNNPSTLGTSVTFTATVTGTGDGAGTPGAGDGSVTFKDNGSVIIGCNAVPLNASGQAACTTAALSPGDHTVAAEYSGAANFATSTGSVLQQVHYDWNGFFRPVENLPFNNTVNAGQAIPVKFSLAGNQGLNIFATGYPISTRINCDNNAPMDEIEETVTAGGSSLSYDPGTGQYIYVWKTEKAWANTCRELTVKLNDNTEHKAKFQFRK